MASSGVFAREESEDEYEDDFEEDGEPSPAGKGSSRAAESRAAPTATTEAAASGAGSKSVAASGVSSTTSGSRRASASTGWKIIGSEDITVHDRLGGGGFAVVHSGLYQGQGVAIKLIVDPKVDEALKKEFMDELYVMSQVEHPNIIKLIGACTKPPKLFFVMERCGSSIFSLLHGSGGPSRRPKPRDPAELIRWATQTALALEYLHGRSPGIIHRDLKSHNVLVARDGTAKLCDFGLVQTKTTTAGTPPYMAPELLQDKPFSRKVDVYAFGMMLWELFAQRVPLAGTPVDTIREKVPAGLRPDMHALRSDTPDAVRELIPRCWAGKPSDRPDFSEIIRSLKSWAPKRSAIDELRKKRGGDPLDALMGGSMKGGKAKGIGAGAGAGKKRVSAIGGRALGGGGAGAAGGGFGR